ncbi:MAG: transposase [Gammaproteobacteria bacterium]|nr:transposase [Gammaproteobacteria bacterium]MDE0611529.1 transposase [Gammaproteobacteria bacterium]
MKVHRTVRYRLHPGSAYKNQQLHGTAGACRFVWNHMVGKLRDEYEYYGECNFFYMSTKNIPTMGLGRTFTVLRKHSYKWLQGYSAYIVKSSLQPIERTYQAFFRDLETGGKLNRKPPKFHGKWTTTPSFSINYESAKVVGSSLYVQKVGWMKMVGANPYPGGEFKSGTVKYECGNWYVYLACEVDVQASLPHSIEEVGIDRNIAEGRLAVLSDGTKHGGPNLEKKVARRKRYQRKMARQVKGSNRRKITKVRLQKAYQAERFARLNWGHHVSKAIASEYDVAYVEKLNIRGMTKSAKGTKQTPGRNVKSKSGLNRRVLASAWGTLEMCLNYKMEVRHVNPAYTSQTCHSCGHVDQDNRKQTDFKCTACGHADDADVNAALNILAFGNGATGRGGGDTGRTSCHSRPVKRQEMGKESLADFAT